ncbi:hypothetical protein L6452_05900 [Arctium lappa]|uniref:Uncharacterized protein n=1 Tax=Arctium lappa TaxID=4217 RepID=A0ACB9EHQ3_ARCLA|nr:hypothetical protein L6452_05900 [Arctium lappa]
MDMDIPIATNVDSPTTLVIPTFVSEEDMHDPSGDDSDDSDHDDTTNDDVIRIPHHNGLVGILRRQTYTQRELVMKSEL